MGIRSAAAHHQRSVRAFDDALARFDGDPVAWTYRPSGAGWSPQDETAHVLRACAYGVDVLAGGVPMPVERPPWIAAILRTVVLPVVLAAGRFPRGGRAPAVLAPEHPETRRHRHPTAADARAAFAALSAGVIDAFTTAIRAGGPPVPHAYFGAMSPELGWRVLSAHTMHHAGTLTSRGPAGTAVS